MGSFEEFAQILEKKIRREIEREFTSTSASRASSSPPATGFSSESWTQLVGNLSPFLFESAPRKGAYTRPRTPPQAPARRSLSPSQEQAWAFFQSHLREPLPGHFNQEQLKRAFRSLALRLHPDHGGSGLLLQELLKARQELEKIFI